ncbi:Deoxycytidylate deaminase [Trichinella pseudospiralis]|uniref:dCMP deaminase n=1 Tax=Trichinella pseudospiralis TaxID=6337 RepID=A0A0V1EG82_TRIPS|nr:Deoxycytidylate deaminase [Trichinella pseudospiralis]
MHSANQKREDYISWTDYFMGVALLSSKRSKDPIMQEGACIVNSDNHIIGVGYNGMPAGCSDDRMPWADQASSILETKHPYICHAALNAVVNKISNSAKGCRLYTTHLPCIWILSLLLLLNVSSRKVEYITNNTRHEQIRLLSILTINQCMYDNFCFQFSKNYFISVLSDTYLQTFVFIKHIMHYMFSVAHLFAFQQNINVLLFYYKKRSSKYPKPLICKNVPKPK